MIPYEKTVEDCLREMFKRVGMKYPDLEFTKNDGWYKQKSWTVKDRSDFESWMRKLYKGRYRGIGKRELDNTVAMFLLMWGWAEVDDIKGGKP